jgi:hypothetical protein
MIDLKRMTEKELDAFILERLSFSGKVSQSIRYEEGKKDDHYRFNMSGYDLGKRGSCDINNRFILDLFADVGIYDYSHFLSLDFYKGVGTLYISFWDDREKTLYEECFSGAGTREIIKDILTMTVLSDRQTRRRN